MLHGMNGWGMYGGCDRVWMYVLMRMNACMRDGCVCLLMGWVDGCVCIWDVMDACMHA